MEKITSSEFNSGQVKINSIIELLKNSLEKKEEIYFELKDFLESDGFIVQGNQEDVQKVFGDNSLMVRNENIRNLLDLLINKKSIVLNQYDDSVNLNVCRMSSGSGFRIAMEEGFGNKEIGGNVSTVISFKPDNISSKKTLPKDNSLWLQKQKTAELSYGASGKILYEDLEMISIRFLKKFFPEEELTETEESNIENLNFIVRYFKK